MDDNFEKHFFQKIVFLKMRLTEVKEHNFLDLKVQNQFFSIKLISRNKYRQE
jgi:hypothetical protein